MTVFTRTRKPKEVDVAAARMIGVARGAKYRIVGGAEYLEAGRIATVDEARADDVLRCVERITDSGGSSISTGMHYIRLVPVEAGTFERMRDRRKLSTPTAPRLADALDLPALAARQPLILAGASRGEFGLRGSGSYDGGRPLVRGRAILELLAARGVTLQAHRGHLLVSTSGHLGADLREVIERGERLLVPLVEGEPALCELRHKGQPDDAWTVLVGGLLACHCHATGGAERMTPLGSGGRSLGRSSMETSSPQKIPGNYDDATQSPPEGTGTPLYPLPNAATPRSAGHPPVLLHVLPRAGLGPPQSPATARCEDGATARADESQALPRYARGHSDVGGPPDQ